MFGVPLHWMQDWATPFPLQLAEAAGARLTDVDGHPYTDFCLGDTGAMFGHSPPAVSQALQAQASRGLTAMLASEDAAVVGELLAERFGLPFWQFAMTATDANRFVLRWLRAATGRQVLLVFNGCYHGTVDDVFVDLVDGRPTQRDSLLGQVQDLTQTTRVVEFNDLAALEAALAPGDVACVLAEPVMTNIGMVLPDPGFWEAAQALIRRHGSLLVLDETHTISSGPGGYARAHGLQPDALVLGKPLGGGMPCAAYGFSAELAARAQAAKQVAPPGHSGIGTTLSGNLLAMAAMRATLGTLIAPGGVRPHAQPRQPPGPGPAGFAGGAPAALVREPGGCALRIPVLPTAAAQRQPGRRGHGPHAGACAAPGPAEPRRADHTLPQHDAGVPRDDRRRCGPPAGRAGRGAGQPAAAAARRGGWG